MLNNLKMNRYGLAGFGLIVLMLIIRLVQVRVPIESTESPLLYRVVSVGTDFYVLLSIVPFIAVTLFISRRLNSKSYTKQRLSSHDRFTLQNIFIGAHLALFLLIIGMLLGLPNLLWQIAYYVIAVTVGLLIPFQLLTPQEPDEKSDDKLEF